MQTVDLISYIMHHISLPLVTALNFDNNSSDASDYATQSVVALLEAVTEESSDLKDILDISEADRENLALRLHMAALCSKIIAEAFKKTKKIPNAHDIKVHIAGLDASLIFCENYIPLQKLSDIYPENANRPASFLKNLGDLKYLESTIPLVNAVCTFSFGQKPQKMIQNVSENLVPYISDMRKRLLGNGLSYMEEKEANRYILHNLAEIYSVAHLQELKRVEDLPLNLKDSETSQGQIQNIWNDFEVRYEILLSLTESIMPDAPPSSSDDSNHGFGEFESLEDFFIDAENSDDGDEQAGFQPMSFYKKE